MAINVLNYSTSGYTVPVWPVFYPHNYNVTTSFSGRSGVYIETDWKVDIDPTQPNFLFDIGTTNTQSFNNEFTINGNSLIESVVVRYPYLFNSGTNTTAELGNFNRYSIKKVTPIFTERFGRDINFTSFASASTYNANYQLVVINFDAPHNLRVGDRLQIFPNIPSFPYYNNAITEVLLTSTATQILTNLKYDPATPANFSGRARLGEQKFDYALVNGIDNFIMLQTTRFEEGNRLYLQQDPVAVATFKMVSGTFGSILDVTVDGQSIISNPIPFNTSIAQTMNDLASEINSISYDITGITAFNNFQISSPLMYLYSPLNKVNEFLGKPITITTSGNIIVIHDDEFYNTAGDNPLTETGWNPQLTNTYIAGVITGGDSIQAFYSPYYNNPAGSNRGSMFSPDPDKGQTITGASYYALYSNNLVNYDNVNFNYENDIESRAIFSAATQLGKFLTNSPSTMKFTTNQEPYVLSILYNKNFSLSVDAIKIDITKPSGTTTYYSNTSEIFQQARSNYWEMINFGVGSYNLNLYDVNNFTGGTIPVQPLIDDDVTEYSVSLVHNTAISGTPIFTAITETKTFKRKCYPKDFKKIYFINSYGALDAISFYGNWERTLNVDRSEWYKKPIWEGAEANESGFNVYYINSTESFKITSDWLSKEEVEWAKEIFTTPFIVVLGTDGYSGFFATVLDEEIVLPLNPNSTLRQLSITLRNNYVKINQKT